MPTPHDALFKQVFSQPDHAVGELRHVLPAAIVDRIDWSTLALRPGSFVDDELRERHSDLLYSVRLAGREAFLYLLLEHKSTIEALTPFQLLGYLVRFWQQHLAQHPNTRLLPVVIAVVVHHSENGWTGATDVIDVLDLDSETRAALEPYLPRFRFVLDDLASESAQALHDRVMSALAKLALFCLKRARHSGDLLGELRRFGEAARSVAAAPDGGAALAAVLRYIMLVQELAPADLRRFVKQEVGPKAEEVLMTTADQITKEAREKALAQGLSQGRAELLLRQLTIRFGPMPEPVVLRVRGASIEELDRWAEAVLSAAKLEQVFDPR